MCCLQHYYLRALRMTLVKKLEIEKFNYAESLTVRMDLLCGRRHNFLVII